MGDTLEHQPHPPDGAADALAAIRPKQSAPHRIVVVGGGAAGLELATRAGERLGRRGWRSWTLRTRISGSRCCMRLPPAAWTPARTR